MAKQRRTVGAFVRIDLNNGFYSFARILEKGNYAFYDVYVKNANLSVNEIKNKDILFIVSVYDYAVKSGRWEKIGSLTLEDNLKALPMKFIQDQLKPDKYELYNPNTGEMIPANKDQCIGLERAAVWEPEHAEDRIRDHFEGKQNKWVEQLKIN